jgi:hypothetical protein
VREVSVRITRKYGTCSDGTGPTIFDTDDPEIVGVQGTVLTDAQALADVGEIPEHESVVLLPRSLFESYLRGRP